MDEYFCAAYVTCAFVGIPTNFLAMLDIILNKSYHSPRYFTWLGVGLSNVLILAIRPAQVLAVRFNIGSARLVYDLMFGIPFSAHLVLFGLSVMDRVVWLLLPQWYRRRVNIWTILICQLLCLAVVVFVVKSVFNSSFRLKGNAVKMPHQELTLRILLPMFVVCLFGVAIIGYKLLTRRQQATRRATALPDRAADERAVETLPRNPNNESGSADEEDEEDRLEWKATHHVLSSFFCLLVFSFPAWMRLWFSGMCPNNVCGLMGWRYWFIFLAHTSMPMYSVLSPALVHYSSLYLATFLRDANIQTRLARDDVFAVTSM